MSVHANYQKYSAIFPDFKAIVDSVEYCEQVKITVAVKDTDAEAFCARITECGMGKDILKKTDERLDRN